MAKKPITSNLAPLPETTIVLPEIRKSNSIIESSSKHNLSSSIKINALKSTSFKQISDLKADSADQADETFGFHDPVYDPEKASENLLSDLEVKKSTHLQLVNASHNTVKRSNNLQPYVRNTVYNALKAVPNDLSNFSEQKNRRESTFGRTFAQPRASFYYPQHLIETKDGMYDETAQKRNSTDFIEAASRRLSYKEYLKQKNGAVKPAEETPLVRFRRLVNSLIQAKRWNVPLYMGKVEEVSKEGNSPMDFDLEQFKANNVANCPERAKYAMTLQDWERNDEDIDVIYQIVKRLKAFHSYNYQTKRELARVITYQKFGPGRIVLQQGHHGRNMYFILKGSVSIQVASVDPKTGDTYNQIVSEIKAGNSFGELALLKDIRRTATVVCKTDTELLSLSKDDFDAVIRVSMEKEWNLRMEVIKNIEYFKSWPLEQLKVLNVRAKMIKINMNKVVLGDTNDVPGVSYFVASGRCFIVRRVKMLEFSKQTTNYKQECFYRLQPTIKPKKTRFPCPKTPNKITARKTTTHHKQNSEWFKQNDNQKKVEKFLVCGVLETGDSFGFGEDLRNIYIITATSTKFITIPTHVLMTEERHAAEHARSSKIENSKVVFDH